MSKSELNLRKNSKGMELICCPNYFALEGYARANFERNFSGAIFYLGFARKHL
jgi:hypothetical protein